MIQIILDSEQEKLLQEQLKTGKYRTPNEVITDALKILAQRQYLNQESQNLEENQNLSLIGLLINLIING
jgi:Arc/MetJ-type ribon-helix-helix transcriptional regulator